MTLLIFGFYFFYLKVKKKYYKLARICHPDRAAEGEKSVAEEKFAIIHQAYVVLSDPREREKNTTMVLMCYLLEQQKVPSGNIF